MKLESIFIIIAMCIVAVGFVYINIIFPRQNAKKMDEGELGKSQKDIRK